MRPTSVASTESPKFSFTCDRPDPNLKESLAESRLSSESPNQVPCSRDRPDPNLKESLAESRLSSESPNQVPCSRDRPDPNLKESLAESRLSSKLPNQVPCSRDRLDPNRKESPAESRLSSESPHQVPCSRDRSDPNRKENQAESRLSLESPNQVPCSRDRPDPNRSLPERLEGLALDQIPPNTRKVGASYSSTTFHYNRRQAHVQCRLTEERKRQQGSWSSPPQLSPTKGSWNATYPDNLGDSTSFKMSMMGNACSLGVVEEDSDEELEPYWQDCVKPEMMEQESFCTPNRRRSAISSLTSQHNKHCTCSHCVGKKGKRSRGMCACAGPDQKNRSHNAALSSRESMSTTPTSLRSSSLSHYLPGRSLNRVQSNSSCDDTAASAASYP